MARVDIGLAVSGPCKESGFAIIKADCTVVKLDGKVTSLRSQRWKPARKKKNCKSPLTAR